MLASKRKGFNNSATKLFCHLFIDLPLQQPLAHAYEGLCILFGIGVGE